jgi:hypothetical protein
MLNTKRKIIGLVLFLAISGMGAVLYLIKDSSYFDNLYNDDTPAKKVVKNLRLGDRFYIESVLIDVFGNSLRPVTQKYIINSAGALSGPCDNYEQVRIGDEADSFADPHSACPGGKLATTIPTIGSSSLLRQGHITKTCEEALRNKVAFDYVLNKIFVDSPISEPDSESLQRAFSLFNPELVLNSKIKGKLLRIDHSNKNNRERWASIILTLCLDPGWQII